MNVKESYGFLSREKRKGILGSEKIMYKIRELGRGLFGGRWGSEDGRDINGGCGGEKMGGYEVALSRFS